MKKIHFKNQYHEGEAWLNPATIVSIIRHDSKDTYEIQTLANQYQINTFNNVSAEDAAQFIDV